MPSGFNHSSAHPHARAPGAGPPALLFTAFEPSGDDHASAVIAELRTRHPDLPIYAWGGPKMEAAGATLIERTGDDAVMGIPGIEKIREHQRINQRIAAWLDANPVAVHIPVDSPGANFPICALAKARGIKVVHLVAPQIWAWARWRIHKLRRLTDLVLCLLPFEERFFTQRDVPARFIGHFLFDLPLDDAALDRQADALPRAHPRLALFPGSRPRELELNFPLMLEVFARVRREYPGAAGVVAATRPAVEERLRSIAGGALGPPAPGAGWPAGLSAVVGQTEAAVRWCDAALVKSGTVTLQVTRQAKPMVIVYRKFNLPVYLLLKTIMATKHYALPNVIAARPIVPEFVPHYGSAGPVARAVLRLLKSPEHAAQQSAELAGIVGRFAGHSARVLGADAIEEIAGLPRRSSRESRLTREAALP